jgi:hypothetical protein
MLATTHAITSLNSAFIAFTLVTIPTTGQAANDSTHVDFEPIVASIEQGKYESAIDLLPDKYDVDAENADIVSLPGVGYRKTRNYLKMRGCFNNGPCAPDRRGANEYPGEL